MNEIIINLILLNVNFILFLINRLSTYTSNYLSIKVRGHLLFYISGWNHNQFNLINQCILYEIGFYFELIDYRPISTSENLFKFFLTSLLYKILIFKNIKFIVLFTK